MKNKKLKIIGPIIAVTTAAILGSAMLPRKTQSPSEPQTKSKCENILTTPTASLCVEIARSVRERAKGLAGRTELPDNYGMLFIFDQDNYHTFWMKGMLIPIDIIWLSRDGEVLHIEENVPPPEPETPDRKLNVYKPPQPARYVLEMRAGLTKKLGIKEGTSLVLPPAL